MCGGLLLPMKWPKTIKSFITIFLTGFAYSKLVLADANAAIAPLRCAIHSLCTQAKSPRKLLRGRFVTSLFILCNWNMYGIRSSITFMSQLFSLLTRIFHYVYGSRRGPFFIHANVRPIRVCVCGTRVKTLPIRIAFCWPNTCQTTQGNEKCCKDICRIWCQSYKCVNAKHLQVFSSLFLNAPKTMYTYIGCRIKIVSRTPNAFPLTKQAISLSLYHSRSFVIRWVAAHPTTIWTEAALWSFVTLSSLIHSIVCICIRTQHSLHARALWHGTGERVARCA